MYIVKPLPISIADGDLLQSSYILVFNRDRLLDESTWSSIEVLLYSPDGGLPLFVLFAGLHMDLVV